MKLQPIVVLGPTCTGKSSLGIELAKAFNGEIISLDAFQVYKGLDIATAKVLDFQEVPHHLIDIVDISHAMTVMEFQTRARSTIEAIRQKKMVPILVGGSALYIQAVLYDFEFHPTDPVVRHKLEVLAEEIGSEALYQRLKSLDPTAAHHIASKDARRIIRALEVNEITGSNYTAGLHQIKPFIEHLKIGLKISTPALRSRVKLRVREMFDLGLVEEINALQSRGFFQTPTACKAIGYEDAWKVSQGTMSENDAIEAITDKTMTFVRKQMKWFKRDSTITWFDADSEDLVSKVQEFVATRSVIEEV